MKVFIENEAGSDQKNIYNEKTLEYKKTYTVSRPYPYPYGFILDTTSGDSDNLDCFVITHQKLKQGQVVECEIVGIMEQREDEQEDHNVLARLPSEEVTLDTVIQERLTDFVSHVFDHLPGKNVRVGDFLGKGETENYINQCSDAKYRGRQYKVIFFDWHKTLSHCDFWGQLKDPTHDRHHWHEKIVNYLFVENDALVQQWMRGRINEEVIIRMISEKFGYPAEPLREDLAKSCRAMTLLSKEILPLITELREKGVKCIIATDNMDVFKKYVVPALKLDEHFDDVLVSFDQKALKFDVSEDGEAIPFFEDYLRKTGLSYKDALLVDDRIDRSGAYEKLDFDTFQVENTEGLLRKLKELASGVKYKGRQYKVLDYSKDWQGRFLEEFGILKSILKDDALAIEHIGSTAVEGLAGKPTIDVLVVVENIAIVDKYASEMRDAGYKDLGEYVLPETRLFVREEENARLVNVHFFLQGHPHTEEMILVRDYLRSHPEEVQKYSELKQRLYQEHPDDYGAYRKPKDEYMEELLKRAKSSNL